MAHTWTKDDLQILEDPNIIDRIGHFIHARQGQGYAFEMPVMGYQALYYLPDYVERVKSEIEIKTVLNIVHEIRRGALIKEGEEGWELCFQATALIRNQLDDNTHAPIGEIDYASDLEYSNIVLYAVQENGLQQFIDWMKENNLS